jgi:uncharacterized protein (DUF302 family)
MSTISVKSTINLTTEQVYAALKAYLTQNGIAVAAIHTVEFTYSGQRQEQQSGMVLTVDLGRSSQTRTSSIDTSTW